jgi:gluconate 2-dehydrogenase gamma chain
MTLLYSPHVSEATRKALLKRLQPPTVPPQFFTPAEYGLLQAIALRLADPMPPEGEFDIAHVIDERLAAGTSNGWRYDHMPPDGEAYRLGLRGVDHAAQTQFRHPFMALTSAQQDAVLAAVQAGNVPEAAWGAVSPTRFFEELLTEVTEYVYAHPHVQQMIGYVGYADV